LAQREILKQNLKTEDEMTNDEEFEKLLQDFTTKRLTGPSNLVRMIGAYFYESRQPEVDSLIHDNKHLSDNLDCVSREANTLEEESGYLEEENAALKSERDELLNALRVMREQADEYWMEEQIKLIDPILAKYPKVQQ
jgi:hypothetical protein